MSFLSVCTSGGCGAKIGAGELGAYIDRLPVKHDENLLVGFSGRDDAAVYKLDKDTALVSTVDFFSPMIDDPFLFGKIAAANALSDIYAMGGTPLFALNLVCFPQKLDKSFLAAMLSGGAEKTMEADTVIAGGHSIYDHEPKYGLAVTGKVRVDRVLRNDSSKPGDSLILTKALGAGIIMCAQREGAASADSVAAAASSMERLNRYAAEACARFPVSACTDVTGFGLLVHASEMAATHTLVIDSGAVPVFPGAKDCAHKGFITSGGGRNRAFMEGKTDLACVPAPVQELLFDPQTSGGLLIAVPEAHSRSLCAAIVDTGAPAAIIGTVEPRRNYPVIVLAS